MPFDGTQLSRTTLALMEGRRRIEAGWCQRHLRIGDSFCAVGAVRSNYIHAFDILQEALGFGRLVTPDVHWNKDSPGRLAHWNDAPGRTKDDVLALYDRAIAISMNRECDNLPHSHRGKDILG